MTLGPDDPFRPLDYRPPLPLERLLLDRAPGDEALSLDVLFVGGGPAGLAGAIELARLARHGQRLEDLEIGVLEKAERLGEHCLSGAVVHPGPFRDLFPDLRDSDFPFRQPVRHDRVYLLSERRAWRLPTPPTMRNHGHFIASICEIVRWLGEKAEALGVNLFTGFPAASLLVQGPRVVGVRTAEAGLGRDGQPGPNYRPATDLQARVVVLAEGTRGLLTQAWQAWQRIGSTNPQIYALGVKELWEVPKPPEAVIHTMGWPLPADVFGGSFLYPMGERQVAVGIVVGLDYPWRDLDVHDLLQQCKLHPLFRPHFEDGELLEWGAKTIPEGGFYSLPERLHSDGLVVCGDAAGFVDVASLKGIHYAMQSGILAARAIYEALQANDTSAARLAGYDAAVRGSFIWRDLQRTRNMRLAFRDGLVRGGLKATLMQLTRGRFPGRRIPVEEDAAAVRRPGGAASFAPDGKLTFRKVDAVFRSGNATRDDIPRHLAVPDARVPETVARFYAHMCPAGVYEVQDGTLVVQAPNCVDCKATDVLGPRWTPREGGSGPKYKSM